jgi:8-oxo-dGTP diphosphatase
MKPIQSQRVAAYAIITAEDHVLLSLLNRGPNAGKWTLIGGGIEFGESPKEALKREIKEEAGVEVNTDPQLLEIFSYRHTFKEEDVSTEIHFIAIVHRLELQKMLACKVDGDGQSSDGTRWFKISEIKDEELNPTAKKALAFLRA